MRYTHCFWDLDGTLVNTAPSVTHSVQHALAQMGLSVPHESELLGFIGPPLLDGFSHFIGLSDADSERAVGLYRAHYKAGALFECSLYDGVREVLDRLHTRGIVSVVATCKPHEFASRIVDHLGISDRIAFVSGPEMDGTRGSKQEVISYAAAKLGITDLTKCLMLGDRGSDVMGAAYHGMDCVGALWGFGSREELLESGARYLCTAPREVLSVLFEETP